MGTLTTLEEVVNTLKFPIAKFDGKKSTLVSMIADTFHNKCTLQFTDDGIFPSLAKHSTAITEMLNETGIQTFLKECSAVLKGHEGEVGRVMWDNQEASIEIRPNRPKYIALRNKNKVCMAEDDFERQRSTLQPDVHRVTRTNELANFYHTLVDTLNHTYFNGWCLRHDLSEMIEVGPDY